MSEMNYKGLVITVKTSFSARFGTLYIPENTMCDSYEDQPAFKTEKEAIDFEKMNIDAYLDETESHIEKIQNTQYSVACEILGFATPKSLKKN